MRIDIPAGAGEIIEKLSVAGFDAYVVGGCVRDCLVGRVPGDWDITTNALPTDIKAVFAGQKMIDIGERHGTIAVKSGGGYYEVTTYRIDGAYGDGRRPDSVSFTNDLREDLRRRDFTINAMAYSPTSGLVDYFGGHADAKNKIIRCVGDAAERFAEDYLRIMRAYRFAATLNFALADDVRAAALAGRQSLLNIAVERVQTELAKLLLSDNFDAIEVFFKDCADVLFPEITQLKNLEQNNVYHIYDVWDHTFAALRHTPPDLTMRLAALFHDVGKFATKTTDEKGIHHFHGHAKVSHQIAEKTLKKWRFDNNTIQRTLCIVSHHHADTQPDRRLLKRLINKLGADAVIDILTFQAADNSAKSQLARDTKLKQVLEAKELLEDIISSDEPIKITDLTITGQDIMRELNIGPSAAVGQHLARLMAAVIDNPKLNTREDLIALLHEGGSQDG
ncbi:MAG: CCA tRNA nucleotidyltransferase [Defluviitaleaceae bacterium]|nr:CCA tRNA nucleotidyltransferase [Defluviitaleaceae bacterium]